MLLMHYYDKTQLPERYLTKADWLLGHTTTSHKGLEKRTGEVSKPGGLAQYPDWNSAGSGAVQNWKHSNQSVQDICGISNDKIETEIWKCLRYWPLMSHFSRNWTNRNALKQQLYKLVLYGMKKMAAVFLWVYQWSCSSCEWVGKTTFLSPAPVWVCDRGGANPGNRWVMPPLLSSSSVELRVTLRPETGCFHWLAVSTRRTFHWRLQLAVT